MRVRSSLVQSDDARACRGNLRRRRDAPLSSSDVDATVQFRPKVWNFERSSHPLLFFLHFIRFVPSFIFHFPLFFILIPDRDNVNYLRCWEFILIILQFYNFTFVASRLTNDEWSLSTTSLILFQFFSNESNKLIRINQRGWSRV